MAIDKKAIYITSVLLLLGGFAAWYLFGAGVFDDRTGANEVRADLRTTADQQQAAIERLGNIENGLANSAKHVGEVSSGLGDVTGTINHVETRIDDSQNRASDSASLIAEGQRILEGVRARGQKESQ